MSLWPILKLKMAIMTNEAGRKNIEAVTWENMSRHIDELVDTGLTPDMRRNRQAGGRYLASKNLITLIATDRPEYLCTMRIKEMRISGRKIFTVSFFSNQAHLLMGVRRHQEPELFNEAFITGKDRYIAGLEFFVMPKHTTATIELPEPPASKDKESMGQRTDSLEEPLDLGADPETMTRFTTWVRELVHTPTEQKVLVN